MVRGILFLFMINAFSLPMAFSQTDPEEEPTRGTQLGLYLMVDSPFRQIMPEMHTTGMFGVSLAQSPFYGSPMFIEFKAAWGNYSVENYSDQNFEKNGWLYPADPTYKSGYQKYLLGTKFMLGRDFRAIRGFATPQIGLLRMRTRNVVTWYDGSTVGDQNSDGAEHAYRTAVKSTGFVFGGEIGTEISIQQLIKPESDKNTFRLLLSASFLRGTSTYRYADCDEMVDPTSITDQDVQSNNYILMSHPQLWESKYGKVYSSPLQLWGINVGLTITL